MPKGKMKQLLDRLTEEMSAAFAAAGYDAALGKVGVSARQDLGEYQCNGAMAGAKRYHKSPMAIAGDVVKQLEGSTVLEQVNVVKPGFINVQVSPIVLRDFLQEMGKSEKFGMPQNESPKMMILDYGGPNVAKPLHVGHLRSAVIGDSIKRIVRYHGDTAVGDIHLGDWGLQMGLVITEIKHRKPDLPYFDETYTGTYPEDVPITVSDLEEIYPSASARSKEDEAYHKEALENTAKLQKGDRGCRALWQYIMKISVADMKRNYANLGVSFDLWNGESTVNDLIPGMVEKMKRDGYAYESNGALVVDVEDPKDSKAVPPCMILKSDGAALYTTTDLATIQDREDRYHPDEIIYITDKRQTLHFTQVFRAAKKCGLCPSETSLCHIGFGTVNGKDGKPFKTREGGVMRLESLIAEIDEEMLGKIRSNPDIPADEQNDTAHKIALSAIKYGDLSNQASKDYIFDMDKFTSFEGDTGPYILYTIVRIKSILAKYRAAGGKDPKTLNICVPRSRMEKNLMLDIAGFGAMMEEAYEELAPHRICEYIYSLSNDFNSFYHETRILTQEDEEKKEGWIALLDLCCQILETCIDLLGFEAPDRM